MDLFLWPARGPRLLHVLGRRHGFSTTRFSTTAAERGAMGTGTIRNERDRSMNSKRVVTRRTVLKTTLSAGAGYWLGNVHLDRCSANRRTRN